MALDFLVISTRKRKGVTELYPTFKIDKANDLMTRGGDFYAIWDQNKNLWSTDEYDAIRLVDAELEDAAKDMNYPDLFVSYMWNSDTGSIDRWHKYVQKQRPERFHELDTHVIFANEITRLNVCRTRSKKVNQNIFIKCLIFCMRQKSYTNSSGLSGPLCSERRGSIRNSWSWLALVEPVNRRS